MFDENEIALEKLALSTAIQALKLFLAGRKTGRYGISQRAVAQQAHAVSRKDALADSNRTTPAQFPRHDPRPSPSGHSHMSGNPASH
ncbi:MAG TPA: hypothetical protein VGN52_23060 [Burkholderiales bacterium]